MVALGEETVAGEFKGDPGGSDFEAAVVQGHTNVAEGKDLLVAGV